MAKRKDTQSITVLHPVCCGLDVHEKTIGACLLSVEPHGEDQVEIGGEPEEVDCRLPPASAGLKWNMRKNGRRLR